MSPKKCEHGTAPYSIPQFTEVLKAVAGALPKGLEGTDPKKVIGAVQKEGETLGILLKGVFAELLQERGGIYPVTADYFKSIEEMVMDGQYDWSNSDITSAHFPAKLTGKVETKVELVHFSRNISSDDAIKELDKMGYRPAEAHELLAFGAKYPDVQREFPIVALGSVWRCLIGDRNVVCLIEDGAGRDADLYWFESGWDDDWRFATVRK